MAIPVEWGMQSCPECHGLGQIVLFQIPRTCPTCAGQKRVPLPEPPAPPTLDPSGIALTASSTSVFGFTGSTATTSGNFTITVSTIGYNRRVHPFTYEALGQEARRRYKPGVGAWSKEADLDQVDLVQLETIAARNSMYSDMKGALAGCVDRLVEEVRRAKGWPTPSGDPFDAIQKENKA